ncbi:MAG: recombinase family protein, partial [Bacteroides sp.]|nr:recombinase family protein [Bacteroides sp.]
MYRNFVNYASVLLLIIQVNYNRNTCLGDKVSKSWRILQIFINLQYKNTFFEALDYCKANKIDMLLVSELSRLGRNAFEVLDTVKMLVDEGINLY